MEKLQRNAIGDNRMGIWSITNPRVRKYTFACNPDQSRDQGIFILSVCYYKDARITNIPVPILQFTRTDLLVISPTISSELNGNDQSTNRIFHVY